jgi:hypothetical protein
MNTSSQCVIVKKSCNATDQFEEFSRKIYFAIDMKTFLTVINVMVENFILNLGCVP